MSQRSNCFKVHPDQEPGPCCNCGQEDISKRYVHLIHKKSENPGFCNFIKENYKISDLSCICRKCELKFKRIFAGTSEDIQGPSLSKKKKKTCTIEKNISNEKASCFLHQFSKCDKTADHTTTVDPGIFQKVFDINLEHLQDTLQVSLCHIHYNTLSNWKREQVCIVCEKISRTKRFICISDCTNDLFLQYLKQELNFEAELNISEKMYCCSYCYNSFNLFCRSEAGEEAKYQTPQYLIECLNKLTCIDPVDVCAYNIDTVTLHHIIEFVVKSFLDDKPLLLPVVYEKYMNLLKTNINTFKCTISGNEQLKLLNHNLKWLLRMLKVKLGKGLLHFVPKRKKDGCLIYRNGADLLSSLHTMTVNFYSTLNEKMKKLQN
ncbi:unnamed protein product [Mytilus coruscus]|uniref:Uncharacterized protein n=1 Tax=Mytilus coruscus TaxID=42192 RepID=A0A6J7ZZV8_MYTCO|nr:unnamed protein product [Mytilus coruscus]